MYYIPISVLQVVLNIVLSEVCHSRCTFKRCHQSVNMLAYLIHRSNVSVTVCTFEDLKRSEHLDD